MAEYYRAGISRKRTKRRKRSDKPIWIALLDCSMYILMALLIVSSVVTVVCQYISPAKVGILSVVALVAPILYLLDIIVALYWVVRLRWRPLVVMVAVVVMGSLYLPRYYAADVWRDHKSKYTESRYLKILTYNLQSGHSEALVDRVERSNSDIICLQEAALGQNAWKEFRNRYNSTYNVETGGSIHIFTRYRILESGLVGTLPRQNGMWADILVKKDTIRVVNLHLRSTAIRSEDTKFLERHEYLLDTARNSKLSSIVSRLTENNIARAEQAQMVAEFLKDTKHKVILAGDFNDVPISYVYNTVRGDLDDAFVEAGSGYAYTYDTAYHILRIDNIFVSPSIEIESYEVDTDADFSDHFPLFVRARVPERE